MVIQLNLTQRALKVFADCELATFSDDHWLLNRILKCFKNNNLPFVTGYLYCIPFTINFVLNFVDRTKTSRTKALYVRELL